MVITLKLTINYFEKWMVKSTLSVVWRLSARTNNLDCLYNYLQCRYSLFHQSDYIWMLFYCIGLGDSQADFLYRIHHYRCDHITLDISCCLRSLKIKQILSATLSSTVYRGRVLRTEWRLVGNSYHYAET